MLSAIYRRRPPRRPPTGIEQLRAKRRGGPFRLTELGAWASRKSKPTVAAVEPVHARAEPVRARAKVPALVRAAVSGTDRAGRAGRLALDWPALLAAGHPDPRDPNAPALAELQRLAAPLVRKAFAEQARERARIVLITSAEPGAGRTHVAISLALALARRRPVLLVDADPGPGSLAARFGLGATAGLYDALAADELQPDRLIVATELDRLALLGPGEPRADLLELLARRRTLDLLRALLCADPARLILIDGPPLSRPEGQALALFAGQVLLVVAAGATRRDALESALARLGEQADVSLLLNRAPVTSS